MSEKENDDVHRITRSPVHPAVTLAATMARKLHADRVGAITAEEFEDLFVMMAAAEAWRDHSINLRTAALMVATALQLQVVLEQVAAVSSARSPSDPSVAEANAQARQTMEAVTSLSILADRSGGAPRP